MQYYIKGSCQDVAKTRLAFQGFPGAKYIKEPRMPANVFQSLCVTEGQRTLNKMEDKQGYYLDMNYRFHYPVGATHMDGFPEELKEVAHPHWASFPPQHPLIVSVFGIFFFLLTFVCLIGNGLVIWVFLSTKHLRTPVT